MTQSSHNMRMNANGLIALSLLFGALLTAASAAETPNVVFIISDDHGWADYSFLHHPHVRTPHIDRLAAEALALARQLGDARGGELGEQGAKAARAGHVR